MKRYLAVLCGALALPAAPAWATNGYFMHGYGMEAIGRGGTAMAVGRDAFAGANNPATLIHAGDQVELGMIAFRPERSASRTGLGPGLDGATDSRNDLFPIPELAYSHMLHNDLALGVSVYANGGMNTDYPSGQFNCGRGAANILCGSTSLGVNMTQLFVAPTVAYALTPHQSIGIAPLFAAQRFSAEGLQAFSSTPGLSVAPDRVTNQGGDYSYGLGYRIGYQVELDQNWAFGASYSGKLHMSRFSRYAGLFARHGSFDVPENYAAGAVFRPDSSWTFALDYQRINYSGVSSVGSPSQLPAQLGADNGPGFGWHDVNVWKLGVEYAASPRWTLRAGFDHTDNPVHKQDITFNILAPGVVTNHATLGFTYHTSPRGDLTVAYMHAFKHATEGTSILPVFMGGQPAGQEHVAMYQDLLGVSYSWKFAG
jgi:long-chain fatty acid transport protein